MENIQGKKYDIAYIDSSVLEFSDLYFTFKVADGLTVEVDRQRSILPSNEDVNLPV